MSRYRSAFGIALALSALIAASIAVPALSAEPAAFDLTIKDHRFEPSELKVPAGQAFVIRIKNLDATAEEFDSRALKIEKVIAGKSEGTVRSRGLEPGRYEFIGEYNSSTAKGVLIAE